MDYFPKKRPDIVLSDAAVQISGNPSVDMPRTLNLLECVLQAAACLPGGHHCLLKTFQGAGLDECLHNAKHLYATIRFIKPGASRASSREVYVLAQRA